MRAYDGTTRMLSNVRFVLDLRRNLISLDALDVIGYSINLDQGIMKVLMGSLVVMKCVRQYDLYILQGRASLDKGAVLTTSTYIVTKLLHSRMGHINEKRAH